MKTSLAVGLCVLLLQNFGNGQRNVYQLSACSGASQCSSGSVLPVRSRLECTTLCSHQLSPQCVGFRMLNASACLLLPCRVDPCPSNKRPDVWAAAADVRCKTGDYQTGSRCLHLIARNMNALEAKIRCAALDGKVATVNSVSELQSLLAWLAPRTGKEEDTKYILVANTYDGTSKSSNGIPVFERGSGMSRGGEQYYTTIQQDFPKNPALIVTRSTPFAFPLCDVTSSKI